MRILVTGATGFVGSHLVRAALDAGHEVVALARRSSGVEPNHPNLRYVAGDIVAGTFPPHAEFAGCDAAVHLVGIIREVPSRGQTFAAVHVEGTLRLLKALIESGFAGRFVYVSAIGSSLDAPSEYSRTKARAEEEVRRSGLPFTIVRPSVILGKGCEFLTQLEELIRKPPLAPFPPPFVPVPGSGANRFQPVDISDLNDCILRCLENEQTAGCDYEIGGGTQVTFDELLEAIEQRIGVKKPHFHVPMPLMKAAAAVLESVLPNPPITTDQLANLQRDNVCDNGPVERDLGIRPLSLEQALERIYGGR